MTKRGSIMSSHSNAQLDRFRRPTRQALRHHFVFMSVALLLWMGLVKPIRAGASLEDVLSDTELLLRLSYDVLVITVLEADDGSPTAGQPPQTKVRVDEVLRGAQKAGDTLTAVWEAQGHDVDWGGAEAEELIAKWAAQPVSSPQVDSKWLVIGSSRDGVWRVSQRLRSPYSEARRLELLDMLENGADRLEKERIAEEKARLELATSYEQERVASAQLELLASKADLIVVGRILEVPSGDFGPGVCVLSTDEVLKDHAARQQTSLVVIQGGWRNSETQILFLCHGMPEVGAAAINAFELCDSRHGYLPADETRLDSLRRLLD
jgi:hypothetical protein